MVTSTYFLKNAINNYVKIGKSNNVKIRMAQVEGQCNFLKLELFYSVEGDFENYLHNVFKKYRKEGEWFDIPNLTMEMIQVALINAPKKVINDYDPQYLFL